MSFSDQPDFDDPLLSEYEERFLEQHFTQDLDAPFDMLDALEASIENPTGINLDSPFVGCPPPFVHDPLWDQLDRVEKETENQVIRPPIEVSPFDGGPPPVAENREAENPLPNDDLNFIREGKLPECRMRGGSTGIRNSGSTDSIFCPLLERYVDPSVCEDCEYSEEAEDGHKCSLKEGDNDDE